ncbi:MAG: sigma 54-interacting transcriptional regulator [Deltaproteobacteria bacterium]|nr:sigma 54-interacting transcriptional regulator [Deltaproteobacteria bacterium]
MTQHKHILIVDDEPRNLRLIKDFLEVLGHSVEPANDGFEALEKLKSGFDLVLLDIMMPGMDGFEVVRHIRENQEFADIPVIMVTVLDDKQTRIRAVQAGANDFINKPIDRLELSVRIESLLKMKDAQDAIKRHRAELEETVERRTSELLESERRFRTLFESAQDSIFIKDKEHRYIDINTAAVDLLQMGRSEIIGKTDMDLFGAAYAPESENVECRVLQGQTIETQQNFKWKSQPISLDVIRFPLRDSSGEITGICGIARELVKPVSTHLDGSAPISEYLSAAMLSTLAKANLAAETNSVILLTGETGSGKDHLARYIHDRSSRSSGPFYAINCSAIPAELAESELFGHEAGAYTGALRRKRGMLELAEGGTLLLNEIGELAPLMQSKLLTFLDTFSFSRVGGDKSVTVNTRPIAATNRDLWKEVSEGRFRKDLFYRLNVFGIDVPPLRERQEDIPVITKLILTRLCNEMQFSSVPKINLNAMNALRSYTWPGNVRELRNVLERALIISRGDTIRIRHLGLGQTEWAGASEKLSVPSGHSLYDVMGETERLLIEDALSRSGQKKREAARLLGISRFALVRHMTKLGINER